MIGKNPGDDQYNGFFKPINEQIEYACGVLSADPLLQNGFHAVGFSQAAPHSPGRLFFLCGYSPNAIASPCRAASSSASSPSAAPRRALPPRTQGDPRPAAQPGERVSYIIKYCY